LDQDYPPSSTSSGCVKFHQYRFIC